MRCTVLAKHVGLVEELDRRVEVLKEGPPADELSAEVAAQLSPTGIKVVRGTSRTVAEIWPAKEWAVPQLEPKGQLIYPFQTGQLIAVVRFPRDAADFRNQDIKEGVYTLRYALQPVDGAHVGTSLTRDFVLLVKAEQDETAAVITDIEELNVLSMDAAESSHPAIFSLQRVQGEPKAEPAIRHDENHDWWIVTFQSKAKAGDQSKPLPVSLVVVGHAEE